MEFTSLDTLTSIYVTLIGILICLQAVTAFFSAALRALIWSDDLIMTSVGYEYFKSVIEPSKGTRMWKVGVSPSSCPVSNC